MAFARILIVEDEGIIAMAIKNSLESYGYQVCDTAFSGEEAIEKASRLQPDLILMDVILKGEMDGVTAAQIIYEKYRTPIIFLTAFTDEATLVRAKLSNPYGYILKPFEDRELYAVIEMALYKRQMELLLNESEERFHGAFEYAAVGMALVSADGKIIQVNPALCSILGYSREQLLQFKTNDISYGEDKDLEAEKIQELLAGTLTSFQIEKRYHDKLGKIVWSLLSVSLAHAPGSNSPFFIFQIQDITRRKMAEDKLQHLAHFDSLTGLANRSLLEARLRQALTSAAQYKQQVAILFLDLDRFKMVNDTLGHDAGDLLLQAAAERLKARTRINDTVARLGGDEFVIILPHITQVDTVVIVVSKILEALSEPFLIRGKELLLAASVGISLYPSDGEDAQTLLKRADIALYRSKAKGGNGYEFCTTEMSMQATEKAEIETGLRHAINHNEFVLHYQPKVDLKTGAVIGVEALVRWERPQQGLVYPGEFIGVAEETGLIVPIGLQVLKKACEQTVFWQKAAKGKVNISIAVNLSIRQIREKELIPSIIKILDETGIDPHFLELELTESLLMLDMAASVSVLRELKKLGVKIAVDDFGTGYSSLSYLKQFAIDRLKIDQAFIGDVTTDNNDAAIVIAIIAMAHSLGIKVIAEGVETQAQLKFLIDHGCDEIQGYYFSPPVTEEKILPFLQGKHLLKY